MACQMIPNDASRCPRACEMRRQCCRCRALHKSPQMCVHEQDGSAQGPLLQPSLRKWSERISGAVTRRASILAARHLAPGSISPKENRPVYDDQALLEAL